MTAAYFSGVDIEEDFHLVILSDDFSAFSLLTISEIRQIVGRCRRKLLSTDILIPQAKYDIKLLKISDLVQVARKALANARPYYDTLRSIKLDENAIIKNSRAQSQLTFNNVLLLRVDRYDQLRISTFTIDQYWNSQKELRRLYSLRGSTGNSLSEYFAVTIGKDGSSGLDFTDHYRRAFLSILISDKTLNEEHAVNEDEKRIFARFKLCELLLDHSDISWIIDCKYWSRISLKKEYITRYLCKFPKMHKLWKSMKSSFEIGKFYTDAEIKNAVSAALVHYTDNIISISSSDYIPILGGFFDIIKTSSKKKNGYKINAMKNAHSRFSVTELSADEVNEHRRYWEMF